jgi:heat shock protein HslJ
MKILRTLIIAVIALSAVACCKCDLFQKRYGKPLVGTQWQLVQIEGRDVTPEDNYTIIFAADNTLSGIAECNRLTARYSVAGEGDMMITDMGTTRMLCPNEDQERRFLDILSSTTDFKMDGPMLMLISNGEMRAVFQAVGAELPPSK